MPKWLIPLIVAAWLGAGYSAYRGTWVPLLVFAALGILAATSAAGMIWAKRGAMNVVQQNIVAHTSAKPRASTPQERREETKRRHERNRRRRRKG